MKPNQLAQAMNSDAICEKVDQFRTETIRKMQETARSDSANVFTVLRHSGDAGDVLVIHRPNSGAAVLTIPVELAPNLAAWLVSQTGTLEKFWLFYHSIMSEPVNAPEPTNPKITGLGTYWGDK